MVYVIAGGFYGLAGVFISAQTGAGDPLVGNPMLLQMFAAVVVGGTLLGGGRGGLTGSVLGAYVLMIIVNILLVLNVSAYYSTVAESAILLLAVLSASLHRKSVLARNIRQLATRLTARREGTLPSQLQLSPKKLVLPGMDKAAAAPSATRQCRLPSRATRRSSATRCRPMSASSACWPSPSTCWATRCSA